MSLGLPNIDTIKDLFTGSISDKLKAWIEPHAIVNAAIFLTLNLALVYPILLPALELRPNPFISSLLKLSSTWQIVLGGVALLLLSYLINTFGIFFLSIASGDVFRDTPIIDGILRGRQRNRYESLRLAGSQPGSSSGKNEKQIKEEKAKRNQAAYRFAYDFPVEESELGLTSLGNLLISPSSYIFHQYGASSELVWPIIQDKLGENDKTAKLVQENWLSLLFLTSLEILLLIVTLELFLAAGFARGEIPWLQVLLLVSGAFLCYKASLEKARQWSSSLRRLFDLKINVAFPELGLKALSDLSPVDKKFTKTWREVSSWLAYGAHSFPLSNKEYPPQSSWYSTPKAETWPQFKHPGYLQVEFLKSSKQVVYERSGSKHQFHEVFAYMFAVTNKSAGEESLSGEGAYLVVMDKLDLAFPPQSVAGKLYVYSDPNVTENQVKIKEIDVEGKQDPAGEFLTLTFPLGNIASGSSRILRYSIKSLLASVDVDPPDHFSGVELGVTPSGRYGFKLTTDKKTKAGATVVIENFMKLELKEEAKLGFTPVIGTLDPQKGNRRVTWTFPPHDHTETVMITLKE